jgi:hypothetical protein
VVSAIEAANASLQTLADAADITTAELEDRLAGRVEFETSVLVDVGGVLRVPATRFLEA